MLIFLRSFTPIIFICFYLAFYTTPSPLNFLKLVNPFFRQVWHKERFLVDNIGAPMHRTQAANDK